MTAGAMKQTWIDVMVVFAFNSKGDVIEHGVIYLKNSCGLPRQQIWIEEIKFDLKVMPKTPLQLIQHHYKDQIKREQKKNEFFYSQTDTFITWLIGFAFTGMILIISNLKAFSIQFNSPLKAIVVSLLITISFGILFRFISLWSWFGKGTWRNIMRYYFLPITWHL